MAHNIGGTLKVAHTMVPPMDPPVESLSATYGPAMKRWGYKVGPSTPPRLFTLEDKPDMDALPLFGLH